MCSRQLIHPEALTRQTSQLVRSQLFAHKETTNDLPCVTCMSSGTLQLFLNNFCYCKEIYCRIVRSTDSTRFLVDQWIERCRIWHSTEPRVPTAVNFDRRELAGKDLKVIQETAKADDTQTKNEVRI